MPKGWRFRSGIGGVLVLQYLAAEDGPSQTWYDAKVTDLHRFIAAQ